MVRYHPESHLAAQIDAQFHRMNVHLSRRVSVDTSDKLLAMVAAGIGWSIGTPLALLRSRNLLDGIRVLLNLDTSTLLSGATISWSAEDGGFRVETPRPNRPERTVTTTGGAGLSGPLAERVQAVFDELVNPRIAAHGGAVELVDVADDVIYVRMTGGCQGCAASALTLRQGIDRMVREEIPEVRDIVDLTDHEAGVNPYY